MCGEKDAIPYDGTCLKGSPPHVRGKADFYKVIGIADRITPACAGKSCIYIRINALVKDHPRMCGEK